MTETGYRLSSRTRCWLPGIHVGWPSRTRRIRT